MTAAQTDSAAVRTWTLKVSCNEDLRRLPSWPQGGVEPSLEAFEASCRELFDANEGEALCIKYTDDDGDLCTLTQATLQDALTVGTRAGGVLRLVMTRESAASSFRAAVAGHGLSRLHLSPTSAREVSSEASGPAQQPSPFSRARPLIEQNFKHFKERVAGDFRSGRKDMREAFHGNAGARPGPVPVAAGCLAGVVVASRMVPVRGLRLVARSAAAVCRPQHVSQDDAPPPEQREASEVAASWSVLGPTEEAISAKEEALEHFKSQVGQDFENARQDVMAAITSFTGSMDPKGHSSTPTAAAPAPSKLLQGAVVLASVGAGACVAGSLVPIRATRLAVATVTSGNAGNVDAESAAAPSVVADHHDQAPEGL